MSMQVTVETTGALERKLRIEYPWPEFEKLENKELEKIRLKAKIDGFRPGKAPASQIKMLYQGAVRRDVAMDLMRDGYMKALKDNSSLKPAGMPSFEPKAIEEGKPFEFVATFEVFPEFDLVDLTGQNIDRVMADVKDADIDATIEKLRKQAKAFKASGQAAQNGDEVLMDFEGYIDDEPFAGGKAEKYRLILGSNSMIPGFEAGLLGIKAGEERTIDVTFPAEYHANNLAGKASQFKIYAHEVNAPVLPEVNEDFIKGYGIADGSIDTFKADLRKELERELDIALKMQLKNAVFDKLLEVNQFAIPKALIDSEIEQLQKAQVQQMEKMYGIKNFDPSALGTEHFEKDATRRVALGILFDKLLTQYDIKPDEEKVRALVEQRASVFDEPEQIIRAIYANKNLLQEMQSMALEEQVVELLLQNAQVNAVNKTFDAVMARHDHHDHDHDHVHGPDCDHDH